jgi:integrase
MRSKRSKSIPAPQKSRDPRNGNTSWVVRYTSIYTGKDAKKRFKTKSEANQFVQNEIVPNLSVNAFGDPSFIELFEKWLVEGRTSKKREFSESHKKNCRSFVNTLGEEFYMLPASYINIEYVTNLENKLTKQNQSAKTISNKIGMIKACLKHSYRFKRIPQDPLSNLQLNTKAKERRVFLDEDQAMSLLDYLSEEYPLGSAKRWIYVVYLTALNTGMRANEIWALKPMNLKPRQDCIRLSHQLSRKTGRPEFVSLKSSGGAERSVPMNENLYEELSFLIGANGTDRTEPIFTNKADQPVDHRNFMRDVHSPLMARWAEEPDLWFHDLRRTAGTLMLRAGIDIREIQEIFGHGDIGTTIRYLNIVQDSVQSVAKKFCLSSVARPRLRAIGSEK